MIGKKENLKVIKKPWGRELWLREPSKTEQVSGRGYCFKVIYLKSGTRSSFQYHEKKFETSYVISGRAELWLENKDNKIEKTIVKEGDFWSVKPFQKHRVIALTSLVLHEVSTPEVDDVIRISDDSGRPDGRIMTEHRTGPS